MNGKVVLQLPEQKNRQEVIERCLAEDRTLRVRMLEEMTGDYLE
jgi:hypothetical protein